jgi:hypothetical protein
MSVSRRPKCQSPPADHFNTPVATLVLGPIRVVELEKYVVSTIVSVIRFDVQYSSIKVATKEERPWRTRHQILPWIRVM